MVTNETLQPARVASSGAARHLLQPRLTAGWKKGSQLLHAAANLHRPRQIHARTTPASARAPPRSFPLRGEGVAPLGATDRGRLARTFSNTVTIDARCVSGARTAPHPVAPSARHPSPQTEKGTADANSPTLAADLLPSRQIHRPPNASLRLRNASFLPPPGGRWRAARRDG